MNKLERIEALEAEIKKLKQEFSEPEFEVGKWYKYDYSEPVLACYQGGTNGYGFSSGCWYNNENWTFDSEPKKWTPATESEVFEALKKEAIKRGFKDNTVLHIDCSGYIGSELKRRVSGKILFCDKHNELYIKGDGECVIFRNGKWAEIIEEPFKVCGYEVKRNGNYYKIVCKKINKEYLQNIYYLMSENDFNTVSFDDKGVDFKTIKKILEL